MEYIYAVLLLNKAGKEVSEDAIKKVLEAAGVKVDVSRVKALVAALEGVDINEAMEKAISAPVAAAPVAVSAGAAPAAAKVEAPKEEVASDEDAAAGLSALFG
ncbi:MAG: 50S ribosomal protein P1 [Candidatus Nanoarchaeia archaeon]|nr:50S ribosomal protein P1 [Candidatus Nanoarchaeia archaeon]